MFPLGTDQAFIDQILVKQANANVSINQLSEYHKSGDRDYSYVNGSWQARFIFDANNKKSMMKTGGVLHYGTDPINTLWEKAREQKNNQR